MGAKECSHVGIEYDEVLKLVRMLNKAGKLADRLGVEMFGTGSGTLLVRKYDGTDYRPVVLATVTHGEWTGGDGGAYMAEDGLLRGE